MLKSEVKSFHIEDLEDIKSPSTPKPEDICKSPPPKLEDNFNHLLLNYITNVLKIKYDLHSRHVYY